MSYLAQNLKVMIWQNKREFAKMSYGQYIVFIAAKVSITHSRFKDILLERATASPAEVLRVCDYFGNNEYDATALQSQFLFETYMTENRDKLISDNMRYLVSLLVHGEKRKFAEYVGVDISTVERWKSSGQIPYAKTRDRIREYFQLGDYEDIENEFLFLELEPIGLKQKLDKCKAMLDGMDKDEFKKIYAALLKLLS